MKKEKKERVFRNLGVGLMAIVTAIMVGGCVGFSEEKTDTNTLQTSEKIEKVEKNTVYTKEKETEIPEDSSDALSDEEKQTTATSQSKSEIKEDSEEEETTASTKNDTKQENASEVKHEVVDNFQSYAGDFGKTLDTIRSEYNIEMQLIDGWLGRIWYRIGNKHMLGFYGAGLSDAENGTDGHSVLTAAQVPLWDIYPNIIEDNDNNTNMSRKTFEEYIGKTTELVLLDEDSEFSHPYLEYVHEDLYVMVFCDENGDIDLENTRCQFGKMN